jgi:hypothetical protein
MFDATDASQSARNNGCRSGLQAVAGIRGIEGWASAVIFDILKSIRESLCPYFHYLYANYLKTAMLSISQTLG